MKDESEVKKMTEMKIVKLKFWFIFLETLVGNLLSAFCIGWHLFN